MKSLSSKSRSNSSEKLSTVKNFNELLQEQRRMLNQYKHQESDNTVAAENQNLGKRADTQCGKMGVDMEIDICKNISDFFRNKSWKEDH